ncbi:MAG: YjbQ family protein [Propioniciclava sp.]
MTVHHAVIDLVSHGGTPSFLSVTDQVRQVVDDSGITDGLCTVMTPHTTCSVYFDEYADDEFDDGTDYLQYDMNQALARIAPDQRAFPPADGYHYPGEGHFTEVESWPSAAEFLTGGDRSQLLNADAHIKSSVVGTSQSFQVADGALNFGVTGSVFFVDWDRARSRRRKCLVTVIGDQ